MTMTTTVDYPTNNFENTHHRNLKTRKSSEKGSFRKQFNHWKEIMDYSENGVPMFNGQNGFKYEMWSKRTEVFL
jgi:hypothetical protein